MMVIESTPPTEEVESLDAEYYEEEWEQSESGDVPTAFALQE